MGRGRAWVIRPSEQTYRCFGCSSRATPNGSGAPRSEVTQDHTSILAELDPANGKATLDSFEVNERPSAILGALDAVRLNAAADLDRQSRRSPPEEFPGSPDLCACDHPRALSLPKSLLSSRKADFER